MKAKAFGRFRRGRLVTFATTCLVRSSTVEPNPPVRMTTRARAHRVLQRKSYIFFNIADDSFPSNLHAILCQLFSEKQ